MPGSTGANTVMNLIIMSLYSLTVLQALLYDMSYIVRVCYGNHDIVTLCLTVVCLWRCYKLQVTTVTTVTPECISGYTVVESLETAVDGTAQYVTLTL